MFRKFEKITIPGIALFIFRTIDPTAIHGILRAIIKFNIFIVLVSRIDTTIDNFIYFRS